MSCGSSGIDLIALDLHGRFLSVAFYLKSIFIKLDSVQCMQVTEQRLAPSLLRILKNAVLW